MPYSESLAEKIRTHLAQYPELSIEEKKMFQGLAFMVNGKMCVNVSGENLMCRFDPVLLNEVSERKGFLPMIMKGKQLNGYCYVEEEGFRSRGDFEFWLNLCIDFNEKAKSSKKRDV